MAGKKGKKNSISQTRGFLYTIARLLGDASAVQKGRVGKRMVRRASGRTAGRTLRRLIK